MTGRSIAFEGVRVVSSAKPLSRSLERDQVNLVVQAVFAQEVIAA